MSLDAYPDDLVHLNTLALVQYRLGQYREAVKTLERCIDARNGQAYAVDYFILAMAQCRCGEAAAAKTSFAKALAWLEGNKTPTTEQLAEYDAFRAEAEEELAAVTSPGAPAVAAPSRP
jgi:tetratricopeptide (TPR) repeat protein